MNTSLPHVKSPCKDCPFRKDAFRGWLGAERAEEIANVSSFVCHKKTDKQCAGHMLLNGERNAFVRMANALHIPLDLSGRELVFDNAQDMINHHEGVDENIRAD